jgi:hypothetical protein
MQARLSSSGVPLLAAPATKHHPPSPRVGFLKEGGFAMFALLFNVKQQLQGAATLTSRRGVSGARTPSCGMFRSPTKIDRWPAQGHGNPLMSLCDAVEIRGSQEQRSGKRSPQGHALAACQGETTVSEYSIAGAVGPAVGFRSDLSKNLCFSGQDQPKRFACCWRHVSRVAPILCLV